MKGGIKMVLFKPNFKPTTKATIDKQIEYLTKQPFISKIVIKEIKDTEWLKEHTEIRIFHNKQIFNRQKLPPYVLIFSFYRLYNPETKKLFKRNLYGPSLFFLDKNKMLKKYLFVHIWNMGNYCLGNAASSALKLRNSNDIVGIVFLMREYIHSCIVDTKKLSNESKEARELKIAAAKYLKKVWKN